MLCALPDGEAVPEDPRGGGSMSATRLQQAPEEARPLRLRRRAGLHRHQPGRIGRKGQRSGGVSPPPGPERKAFWEEEEDGRDKLLTADMNLFNLNFLSESF